MTKSLGQILLLFVVPTVLGGVIPMLYGDRHTILDELLAITFVFAIGLAITRRIWPDSI